MKTLFEVILVLLIVAGMAGAYLFSEQILIDPEFILIWMVVTSVVAYICTLFDQVKANKPQTEVNEPNVVANVPNEKPKGWGTEYFDGIY